MQDITKHYKTLQEITKHQKTLQDITRHHKTLQTITRPLQIITNHLIQTSLDLDLIQTIQYKPFNTNNLIQYYIIIKGVHVTIVTQ